MAIEKYGKIWRHPEVPEDPVHAGLADLLIELTAWCYGTTDEGILHGPNREAHFWNSVEYLWNYEGSPQRFERTPWAEEMVREYVRNKYLGVAGCASSGKSGTFAAIGMVEFLCAPARTKVFMTSTTLTDSRNRIWGTAEKLWKALYPEMRCLGKLTDSLGSIRAVDEHGVMSHTEGLQLIACEKKKEKEAIGKFVGFKNWRVIVIADELPELSEAILTACSNLSSNPYFKMVGLGNPASYYDAFGKFTEPAAGWGSINAESHEWETTFGYCLRFDGEKSPNVIAGKVIYPFMPDPKWIKEVEKTHGGKNSMAYWRMVRGFWCPTGVEAAIYSESEIMAYGGMETVKWVSPPVTLATLDPAFTSQGDSAMARLGRVGVSSLTGLLTLELGKWEPLHMNMASPEPHSQQVANAFRKFCIENNVAPRNAAVDATGGGGPFCDVLEACWSREILRVPFNGAANDKRLVSETDPVPCNIRYANKVTQLWFAGVDLLRNGQLKGIDKETATELTARKYSELKAPPHPKDTLGSRYEVESKKKMKPRLGFSPDKADTAVLLIELASERHGLSPGVNAENRKTGGNVVWSKFQQMQSEAGTMEGLLV